MFLSSKINNMKLKKIWYRIHIHRVHVWRVSVVVQALFGGRLAGFNLATQKDLCQHLQGYRYRWRCHWLTVVHCRPSFSRDALSSLYLLQFETWRSLKPDWFWMLIKHQSYKQCLQNFYIQIATPLIKLMFLMCFSSGSLYTTMFTPNLQNFWYAIPRIWNVASPMMGSRTHSVQ